MYFLRTNNMFNERCQHHSISHFFFIANASSKCRMTGKKLFNVRQKWMTILCASGRLNFQQKKPNNYCLLFDWLISILFHSRARWIHSIQICHNLALVRPTHTGATVRRAIHHIWRVADCHRVAPHRQRLNSIIQPWDSVVRRPSKLPHKISQIAPVSVYRVSVDRQKYIQFNLLPFDCMQNLNLCLSNWCSVARFDGKWFGSASE